MTVRKGQVALYLIAVLAAICVLTLMNVGIFLSVSAKNKATNAGDAAALAAANYQGRLLNRIGQCNLAHLKAALDGDAEECARLATEQLRLSFLGPISGVAAHEANEPYGAISAANDMAKENGAKRQSRVENLLRKHVIEIRQVYAESPELYPAPWEGAWEEYAQALEVALGAGIYAGPDNINFLDAVGGHTLLNPQFYNAVAGKSWCWFKFNAPGLLGSYETFQSWGPLPVADDETRLRRRVNSEVYSLNLRCRVGKAIDLIGADVIARLLDKTADEVNASTLLKDPLQMWMFYDDDVWRTWWEINPDGPWQFPVVGSVRPEYDVRGCAAMCRVTMTSPDVLGEDGETTFRWTAAAKPFGTVATDSSGTDIVTALGGFVVPAFDRAALVPLDAVGGKDTSTADPDWAAHVHEHLPLYLEGGAVKVALKDCNYCRCLCVWDQASFRSEGARWLKFHAGECIRPISGSGSTGGTPHGH